MRAAQPPLPGIGDEAFDPLGPLPCGRIAIEASAGTGKTHALATLATRYVAEGGVRSSELLVVTFTRAAANELRSKVRQRLADTATLVEEAAEGCRVDSDVDADGLARHLAASDHQTRIHRLRQAVAEFDSATITTIHGFAVQVRAALGSGSGEDPSDRVVPDNRPGLREACTDVLAGAATTPDAASGLPTLDELFRLAEALDGRPDIVLFPRPDDDEASPCIALLGRLVADALDLAARRRRAAGLLSFDDVLIRLRNVLADDSVGASAARYLRSRYRVVLIDEFQDTDPVQWSLFSRLFGTGDGGGALVLVGDPKQSIYRFRGADVHVYRRALDDPGTERRVLRVNRRSDGALLDALGALMEGATFGEQISFLPVEAAPGRAQSRLTDGDGRPLPALSLRLVAGPAVSRRKGSEQVTVEGAKAAALSDLAQSVRQVLEGARLPAEAPGSPGTGSAATAPPSDAAALSAEGPGAVRSPLGRSVRPGDVAVLVPTNRDTLDVQAALREAAIPAVVNRGGSVLESEAATQLRWLLHAMERPSDLGRVRLAALTWFGGLTAREVAEAGDDDPDGTLARLQELLRGWSDALAHQPAAAVLGRVRAESKVLERLLARPDGDRNVTDLDHLFELLGSAATAGRVGPAALLSRLDAEPSPVGEGETVVDADEDLTARRVESDADCVQVMTVWTAKGLQFPVVFLPFLWWESSWNGASRPDQYVDTDGQRILDLTARRPLEELRDARAAEDRRARAEREVVGERLRALYVALTRAQHLTVAWWAHTDASEKSAMARVLFGRTGEGIRHERFVAARVSVPPDRGLRAALEPVVRRACRRHDRAMEIEVVDAAGDGQPWRDAAGPPPAADLAAAEAPVVDRRYRRWSFSAIVDRSSVELTDPSDEALGDAGAADEFEGEEALRDAAEVVPAGEPDGASEPADPSPREPGALNPMAPLAGGPAFGTLVHSVLEEVDWQAADLEAALAETLEAQLVRRPVELVDLVVASEAAAGTVAAAARGAGEEHPDGAAGAGGGAEAGRGAEAPGGAEAGRGAEAGCGAEADGGADAPGFPSPDTGRDRLVAGLITALTAPLGSRFAGRRLVDVGRGDRLTELSFDLRLAGRADPTTTRDVARLVREHLPAGDPFARWAEATAGRPALVLAGALTGSIDLVVRVPVDGDRRHVVVDYKTNSLNAPGVAPSEGDYAHDRLAAAMAEHDYPLQALLYSVALHRYLRWRLPGYLPDRHLGGVAYLFLRGMAGTLGADGTARGVFGWDPPPALVVELSDLLDGVAVGAAR